MSWSSLFHFLWAHAHCWNAETCTSVQPTMFFLHSEEEERGRASHIPPEKIEGKSVWVCVYVWGIFGKWPSSSQWVCVIMLCAARGWMRQAGVFELLWNNPLPQTARGEQNSSNHLTPHRHTHTRYLTPSLVSLSTLLFVVIKYSINDCGLLDWCGWKWHVCSSNLAGEHAQLCTVCLEFIQNSGLTVTFKWELEKWELKCPLGA